MTGIIRRGRTFWAACLTVWFILALNVSPVFGHGEEGRRIVLLFDLKGPQTTEPTEILAISDAYQTQLLIYGAHGENGCLHLQTGPTRFSWDKTPMLPPSGTQHSSTADYMVWGDYHGGDTQAVDLYLTTFNRQRTVTQGSGQMAGSPEGAATAAAYSLAGSGEGSTTPLFDMIYRFEQETREKDPETALGPRLKLIGLPDRMAPGQSVTFTISLTDCDGYLLKDRKVKVSATEGRITPVEVTIGADGTASATYTAPSTKAEVSVDADFIFRYPSDKIGHKNTGMYISIRDPKPEDPSIFHVTLEIANTVESRFQSSPDAPAAFQQELYLRESIDPLKLEFDLNQRMEVVEDSLKANYQWSSEFTHSAAVAHGAISGADTNDKLVDWKIYLKRHINPVKDEPALKVYDATQEEKEWMSIFPLPITQPEDTLEIDYYVVIPALVEGEYNVVGQITPMDGETHKSYSDIVEFDYDYRSHSNSDKLTSPPQEMWMVRIVKDEILYTMELKDVKFEFVPSESPSVTVGGEDYSDKFEYVMYWREWTAPIDVYKMWAPKTSAYQPTRAWTAGGDGCTEGYSSIRKLLGELGMYDTTGKPAVRLLREYLVAVKGFPEFGFRYGLITIESFLNSRYDVKIYAPITIDADAWRTIKNGAAPYRDEDSAGEPIRHYTN